MKRKSKKWIDKTTPYTILLIGLATALTIGIIQEAENGIGRVPPVDVIILGVIWAMSGFSLTHFKKTEVAGEFMIYMGVIMITILPTLAMILWAWPMVWQEIKEHKFASGVLAFSIVASALTKLWLERREPT